MKNMLKLISISQDLKFILIFFLPFNLTFGILYVFNDFDEHLLIQNNLIATFASWEKRYYVMFKVNPLSYSQVWGNVIHVTIGGDYQRNGDRNPAVWFIGDSSGSMRIHFSVNGDSLGYIDTPPLLVNSWSTIQICQDIIEGIYLVLIYINGNFIQKIVNNMPQAFENVLVYASDPWYPAKDGFIKDLKIITGNDNMVENLKECALIKDNLIITLPLLEKTFSVSFKVKPKSYTPSIHSSVIHLTIGGDITNYGDRNPGVWFNNDGSGALLISSSINENVDYYILTKPLKVNEWSSIRISQFQIEKIIMYAVYLNGENIHSIENKLPKAFSNVNVYAANPWYEAQDGSIKDVRIINGNEETCGLLINLTARIKNEEVQTNINLTTNCLCYLENITLYLQVDPLLIFKGFLWDDSIINETFVERNGRNIFVKVIKLYKDWRASFSAIFIYGKIPSGRINASIQSYSKWSFCYGDPVYKVNQISINVPIIKKHMTSVVKMNPIWYQSQTNKTFLQTETYQFICTNIQKRQPSPCYQREISTGLITFFSIQLLDVFGYDSRTKVIYGRTHRNNVVEMNIINGKFLIITKERCFKTEACQPFFTNI